MHFVIDRGVYFAMTNSLVRRAPKRLVPTRQDACRCRSRQAVLEDRVFRQPGPFAVALCYRETMGLNAAALQRLATGSARQAPLHGERAASIGAAGDDAEIGARLFQLLRKHMRPSSARTLKLAFVIADDALHALL